jgi:hypothetical protein
MQGTVDQLTALFLLERQLARRGSCDLIAPVFEGCRRYDLRGAAQPGRVGEWWPHSSLCHASPGGILVGG